MKIINDNALDFLIEADSNFKNIILSYGIPPSWSRPEGFETLCRIILEQQVSLESGRATYHKLMSRVKEFSPFEISKLSSEEMRQATVSRQKSGYILGLAKLIIDKKLDLSTIRNLPHEECLKYLLSVRGVGPWTAEVYMLFALQLPDIYPRGDIALIKTIIELWGIQDARQALQQSTLWSPHRSAASFLLWHYYLSKRGRKSPL